MVRVDEEVLNPINENLMATIMSGSKTSEQFIDALAAILPGKYIGTALNVEKNEWLASKVYLLTEHREGSPGDTLHGTCESGFLERYTKALRTLNHSKMFYCVVPVRGIFYGSTDTVRPFLERFSRASYHIISIRRRCSRIRKFRP